MKRPFYCFAVLLCVFLLSPHLPFDALAQTGTDPVLRVEIGSGNSYVILENSEIRAEYEPYFADFDQFAIRKFYLKSAGDEDQVGVGTHRYLDADAGRGTLSSASIVYDGLDRKTVRLEWNDKDDPSKKIIHEVSIFSNGKFLKIDYIDVQNGINIVDNGEPGGTISGTHIAYGADSWPRDYITHNEPEYHGSYYNRYVPDGVNDPVDGGSLNYNGHFILGVYNAANGRGFARVVPVVDSDIIKLIHEPTTRKGLEFFPHAFNQPHAPFTSYLYAVTGGDNEVLTLGQELADRDLAPIPTPTYDLKVVIVGEGTATPDGGIYDEGTQISLEATAAAGWFFTGWSGEVADANSPSTTITVDGDKTVTATFAVGDLTYFEDFEGYTTPGTGPADWLDTGVPCTSAEYDSRYKIFDLGGYKVFGTSLCHRTIQSHYVDVCGGAFSFYEYTGLMMITDAESGIGLTFMSQYPQAGGYIVRRYFNNSFHLSPYATQINGGTAETDLVPEPNVWYRFRIQVEDTGGRTEIRAKVWPDTTAEPTAWQIDAYDDSPTRLTNGTIGVWSFHTGDKYWDDLALIPLSPLSLEVKTVGDGTVAMFPDQTKYNCGDDVGLTATPADGWIFTGWSGDVVDPKSPSTTVTVDGNKTVTATFAVRDFKYTEDFERHTTPGTDPVGWLDTGAQNSTEEDNSLFKVLDLGGYKVFGTTSTQINIHSHYVGAGSGAFSAYEYTGRMMVTNAESGVGVTFMSQYPERDAYYRLRRYSDNSFHLSPHSTQITGGTTDTGVVPAPNAWYRFRIQVEDTCVRTEIRAKVWPDTTAEPAAWQIDAYDDSPTRLARGTIGVWSFHTGEKYWDDLALIPLSPLSLEVKMVGVGTVTTLPNQTEYSCGDEVELTATPADGWIFTGWTGDVVDPKSPSTNLAMDGDKTVKAIFTRVDAIFFEGFQAFAAGEATVDWLNTGAHSSTEEDNSLFEVFDFGGDKVFGTTSTQPNIHSHYVSSGNGALCSYEYTGRMMVTNAESGIGVTFMSQYPQTDAYCVLQRYAGNSFYISQHATQITGGTTDTGVVPEPNVWYQFRIQVEDTGARTEIQAKVWPEGTAEPTAWQADAYDDSPTRLIRGTIGLWGFHAGGKYWDDLALIPLSSLSLTIRTVGEGTVTAFPDQTKYNCGDEVELTATPADGWIFTGWTGDVADPHSPSTTLTMDGDKTVRAMLTRAGVSYYEGFQAFAAGEALVDWLNTGAHNSTEEDNSLFKVFDFGGDKIFGTTSTQANIHSHYVGAAIGGFSAYEYTGRMMMTTADSGIGVTFMSQYPERDAYYRLRRYSDNPFHLSPHGTQITGGITDTGVIPSPNVWYRFRIQVEDTGARTEIRAKVWPEDTAEPAAWQADAYDDSPTRLIRGTMGVWSFHTGEKYWDDLAVNPLPLIFENFEDYTSPGLDPVDWFDTGAHNSTEEDSSLFKVFDFGGDKVFGTTSTQANIHSHYVGAAIGGFSAYEYTGRMMMTTADSGIGVTFMSQYPERDAYYRLRRYSDNSFHLSPHGTQITGGITDTGVIPSPNVWYRFRIRVEDTGNRTQIRAKVWPEDTAEPAAWQADAYDDSPTRLINGTIGVWSFHTGEKYWDDLAVYPLPPSPAESSLKSTVTAKTSSTKIVSSD